MILFFRITSIPWQSWWGKKHWRTAEQILSIDSFDFWQCGFHLLKYWCWHSPPPPRPPRGRSWRRRCCSGRGRRAGRRYSGSSGTGIELQTKVCEAYTIMEKACSWKLGPWRKDSVLNVKALVGAFNQEKALVSGLLRDCEIFGDIRITFVSSCSVDIGECTN